VHVIGETLQNALMVRLRPINLHTCDIKTCVHPIRVIVHIQATLIDLLLSSIPRGGDRSQGKGGVIIKGHPPPVLSFLAMFDSFLLVVVLGVCFSR
ncbi:mCG145975, partial [Mus musculus]